MIAQDALLAVPPWSVRIADVGRSARSWTDGDPGPPPDDDGDEEAEEDEDEAAAEAAAALDNTDAPNPGTVRSALANSLDDSGLT